MTIFFDGFCFTAKVLIIFTSDLVYHCEKCEPRDIDYNAARAYQAGLVKQYKQMSTQEESAKTSTDTGSTDDDEFGTFYVLYTY